MPIIQATLEDNFIVLKFAYDQELVRRVKKIEGRRWHPDRKVWTVPATSLDQLKLEFGSSLYILFDPKEAITDKPKRSWEDVEIPTELRSSLKVEPYPYQWVGGAAFLPTVEKGILADEMGLGRWCLQNATIYIDCKYDTFAVLDQNH